MCYIQITSVCNMSCSHCCMSCGKNYKGQHMSESTYLKALEFTSETSSYIVIGGGEPTLHPHFKDFLLAAIKHEQQHETGVNPFVVTNGSKFEISMWLANNCGEHNYETHEEFLHENWGISYSENGYFDAVLSQDIYHDPVDQQVVDAFKRSDGEGIRNVSNNIFLAGHAINGDENCCACSIHQIKPDGKIFLCGCDNSPQIGTVDEGIFESWSDIHFGYDFENCINTPQTYKAEIFCVSEYQTIAEWVDENITVKKSKVNHPDTHREELGEVLQRKNKVSEGFNFINALGGDNVSVSMLGDGLT